MSTTNLTNTEINKIAEAAKASRPFEKDMLGYKDSVQVNENAEIEAANVETPFGTDAADLMVGTIDSMPSADVSLFDVGNSEVLDEAAKARAADTAKGTFDLSDEDTYEMLNVISEMKKDPNYPVYTNLPEKLKEVIRQLAYSNNIPFSRLNMVARMVMEEFLKEASVEQAFVDFEKSLNEALNIPSIIDLYTEHTRTVMEENIPAMIERIKDEAPEKAEMLQKVKDAFTRSYNFSDARKAFEENARIRKAMRRHDIEFKRSLNEFNFRNEKSNFKMNDVTELPTVLYHILIEEPDTIAKEYKADGRTFADTDIEAKILSMNINGADIEKLCILLCKSCGNLDPHDVIDAAYMYYMMKNIIVLKHTREAKTDFAIELINNICDLIAFIRDKEAEFNAANLDKSKSSKKSNSGKSGKR